MQLFVGYLSCSELLVFTKCCWHLLAWPLVSPAVSLDCRTEVLPAFLPSLPFSHFSPPLPLYMLCQHLLLEQSHNVVSNERILSTFRKVRLLQLHCHHLVFSLCLSCHPAVQHSPLSVSLTSWALALVVRRTARLFNLHVLWDPKAILIAREMCFILKYLLYTWWLFLILWELITKNWL